MGKDVARPLLVRIHYKFWWSRKATASSPLQALVVSSSDVISPMAEHYFGHCPNSRHYLVSFHYCQSALVIIVTSRFHRQDGFRPQRFNSAAHLPKPASSLPSLRHEYPHDEYPSTKRHRPSALEESQLLTNSEPFFRLSLIQIRKEAKSLHVS